jgi:hypothetical protein
VLWNGSNSLGFSLSDGQSCKAGTYKDFDESHIFDPSRKITKVEVIIDKSEYGILQIKFYSGRQTLVKVG